MSKKKDSTEVTWLDQNSFHGDFSLSPYQEWKWLYKTPVAVVERRSNKLMRWIYDTATLWLEKLLYRFNRRGFWFYVECVRLGLR